MFSNQPEPDIPFPWYPDDEDEPINGDFFTRYLLK